MTSSQPVAEQYPGKVPVYRVDITVNFPVAERFEVMRILTRFLFGHVAVLRENTRFNAYPNEGVRDAAIFHVQSAGRPCRGPRE